MKFQSIKKVENNRYLWDVIDVLRNELSIAEDGHVDYVECIDKLKDEIKELKRIKAEKQVFLADAYVKKAEIKEENIKLKQQVKELKLAVVDQEDDIKSLNKDNKWLADKNKEIIKKKDNEIDDWKLANELKETENKELKHELNHKAIKLHQDRIPKEYKKEADEFFEHNPNQNKVWFFMLDKYEMNDGALGDLMLNEDNALCIIDNDNL
tara:strand:- start:3141 stop:3770 length:630 start_codon:yes stop_codon:yes gene_type:complete